MQAALEAVLTQVFYEVRPACMQLWACVKLFNAFYVHTPGHAVQLAEPEEFLYVPAMHATQED